MARVAAQKTALPNNHPLHRPLKKRQAEACQRIHALWGVWPWELLIPVAMYEGNAAISNLPTSHYQLEHPPDWSDNILDTLRKLALSTTLDHAIARIGYHAALIKVTRLSVRLTKAVTTECEIEREHTPPNPKAGSGPIVNRRNKKTAMQRRFSQDANMADMSRHKSSSDTSSSPRSSSPQSDLGVMSPEARGYYSRACSVMGQQTALPQFGSSHIRGSSHEGPGPLTLPKLHETGLRQQSLCGPERDSAAFSPTSTGLITPLSEEVNSSGLPLRMGNSYTHTLPRPQEHSKLQKRTTLPSFVELPVPRVQLTPPTSPTEPTTLPLMSRTSTSPSSTTSRALYSPVAFDIAMAGVRAIQKANNCPLPRYDEYHTQRTAHQPHPPHYQPHERRQDTLPPIMSSSTSSHQRHHSYHTQTQTPSTRPSLQRQLSGSRLPPISSSSATSPPSAGITRPVLQARSFSSHHGCLPLYNPSSSSSSGISSGPSSETTTTSTSSSEAALARGTDQRMKMSFLM